MATTACCAKSPVLTVVYDSNVHTVASYAALNVSLPLGACAADARSELNPIDMMAIGLASCILIVMGKAAVTENVYIVGAKAGVSYTLDGYRIASFNVSVQPPKKLEEQVRTRLEEACKTCPVYRAIDPSVKIHVCFNWPV
jgi:uncharacterized OsmC-like protein